MIGTPGTRLTTTDLALGAVKVAVRVFLVHEIYGASSTGSVLRDDGVVGGAIKLSLKSTDSQGVTHDFGFHGVRFPNGCFFDIGANVTSATITYQIEL